MMYQLFVAEVQAGKMKLVFPAEIPFLPNSFMAALIIFETVSSVLSLFFIFIPIPFPHGPFPCGNRPECVD